MKLENWTDPIRVIQIMEFFLPKLKSKYSLKNQYLVHYFYQIYVEFIHSHLQN